jgi:hypothetical protein
MILKKYKFKIITLFSLLFTSSTQIHNIRQVHKTIEYNNEY